jgi:uncharacterized membrane protein YdcZ (DUF606 family)
MNILIIIFASFIVSILADYFRITQMTRKTKEPHQFNFMNIIVATAVLTGVIVAIVLITCGLRQEDSRRYIKKGEPFF